MVTNHFLGMKPQISPMLSRYPKTKPKNAHSIAHRVSAPAQPSNQIEISAAPSPVSCGHWSSYVLYWKGVRVCSNLRLSDDGRYLILQST
jgi:hypothetical protein